MGIGDKKGKKKRKYNHAELRTGRGEEAIMMEGNIPEGGGGTQNLKSTAFFKHWEALEVLETPVIAKGRKGKRLEEWDRKKKRATGEQKDLLGR